MDTSQIVLEYTADKKISVNKNDIPINDLETRLRNIFEQRKDKTMFIVGAGSLRYGDIVDVIDAAKGAGVEKVGIVTEGMRPRPVAPTSATSSLVSISRVLSGRSPERPLSSVRRTVGERLCGTAVRRPDGDWRPSSQGSAQPVLRAPRTTRDVGVWRAASRSQRKGRQGTPGGLWSVGERRVSSC